MEFTFSLRKPDRLGCLQFAWYCHPGLSLHGGQCDVPCLPGPLSYGLDVATQTQRRLNRVQAGMLER